MSKAISTPITSPPKAPVTSVAKRAAATPRTGRNPPAQVGNVVALPPQRNQSVVVPFIGRRKPPAERTTLEILQSAVASLQRRHHDAVAQLPQMGLAMNHQDLLDWIEIGRRMLGRGGAA